ncbi:MAG: MBL fold metallo-hydrolase [Candidatus Methanoperedens sp.]|nr:MBL fold metallo-hydrolase [Candidatus Methanoperedens sp.]MCZ7395570.1 MBL fold metallo-hydrolase [Candidatus Methanoperedens sp.]
MKITLLGTGDAVGTPKLGCSCPACLDALAGGLSRRLRFSILVESESKRVLIDTSPDLRWQLLKKGISRVDGVIWTHPHYDHYAGFGDFHRIQNGVNVYGLKNTLDYILNYLSFMKPKRHDVRFYIPFELIGINITLVEVRHPPLLESAGVILTDGKSKIVITGDTARDIPEKSIELMFKPDLLIADAIIPPRARIPKHMNAKEAMELASELEAKKVVLTHLSHLFPPHDESVKEWPLGYDGMEFVF